MEYLVIARDGTDPQAQARRLAAREAHLDGVKTMIAEGTFIEGGAILDGEGNMIGSTLYVAFDDRADLDHWLETDPYVTGDVWQEIEVQPIRLVFRERPRG